MKIKTAGIFFFVCISWNYPANRWHVSEWVGRSLDQMQEEQEPTYSQNKREICTKFKLLYWRICKYKADKIYRRSSSDRGQQQILISQLEKIFIVKENRRFSLLRRVSVKKIWWKIKKAFFRFYMDVVLFDIVRQVWNCTSIKTSGGNCHPSKYQLTLLEDMLLWEAAI